MTIEQALKQLEQNIKKEENKLKALRKKSELKVGDYVTYVGYSDRSAYEVVEIKGNKGKIRRLMAIRTDDRGMHVDQEYRYESMPTASLREITFAHKRGWWQIKGDNYPLRMGANEYFDYSF